MSLVVVLTEPLGLAIGFPLVPFLNSYIVILFVDYLYPHEKYHMQEKEYN